ncbi:hypothetical protein DIPPA_00093 [Diplonema papillatum]|nr:hypothetical protein DIPPA_00093 [Diplonema papillatum]
MPQAPASRKSSEAGGNSWVCDLCSYENVQREKKCEGCGNESETASWDDVGADDGGRVPEKEDGSFKANSEGPEGAEEASNGGDVCDAATCASGAPGVSVIDVSQATSSIHVTTLPRASTFENLSPRTSEAASFNGGDNSDEFSSAPPAAASPAAVKAVPLEDNPAVLCAGGPPPPPVQPSPDRIKGATLQPLTPGFYAVDFTPAHTFSPDAGLAPVAAAKKRRFPGSRGFFWRLLKRLTCGCGCGASKPEEERPPVRPVHSIN